MSLLLHIVLLLLWPGCLVLFIAVLAWDEHRDRVAAARIVELGDSEFCNRIGVKL